MFHLVYVTFGMQRLNSNMRKPVAARIWTSQRIICVLMVYVHAVCQYR